MALSYILVNTMIYLEVCIGLDDLFAKHVLCGRKGMDTFTRKKSSRKVKEILRRRKRLNGKEKGCMIRFREDSLTRKKKYGKMATWKEALHISYFFLVF